MRDFVYDALRRHTTPNVRQAIKSQKWAMSLISTMFGSGIYSDSYYTQVEDSERASVEVIARWIINTIDPKRVIDIGCGPGHLIEALARRGTHILGVDYSAAARQRVAQRGLPFQTFDLTDPDARIPGAPWDMAVCCEVAEHLDARHADTFVKHLASASDTIFLTAAEVGQGGLNHVNEQPNSYWVDKFAECGFEFDQRLTKEARANFVENGVIYYLAKPLLFRRASRSAAA